MRRFLLSLFIIASILISPAVTLSTSRTFEAGKGRFMLDGKPFMVKAAELHYPRFPRQYWDHRIKMAKALGMNTICLYVFWNTHEPRPGEFDFTGQNDLRHFVELCEANGMYVILRPGPYVCAEWEMGGLPWWLLKDKDIELRSNDPRFLSAVDRFEDAVAAQVADKTIQRGGPIIMVQVENEFGSYGKDKEYVGNIRDMLRRHYGDVAMFQCDWSSNFLDNGLDDLVWTLNFGTGSDIDAQFEPLREARPEAPLMCSEFWSGWFDKWGASHETRPADEMIANIDEMLSKDISFSLYMTHGGTNWGHWAGANSPGFAPDVTSYDYDAPINEQGSPTEKYRLLRETLGGHLADGESLAEVPVAIPTMAVPRFELTEFAPLFENLPTPVLSDTVINMESLDQGFGSVLYRTKLPALAEGTVLTVAEPHDYAQVFVDGCLVGVLDRREGETQLRLPAVEAGLELNILVEALGRINFGRGLKDFKGITAEVTVSSPDGTELTKLGDWEIYPLPDEKGFYDAMKFGALPSADDGMMPRGVYRGTFTLPDTGDSQPDTFLDFSEWGKGLVYVNGHPLGRIWQIGPQQTLYTPGCWLRAGENEVLVFDIVGPASTSVEGFDSPELDRLLPDRLRGLVNVGESTGEKPDAYTTGGMTLMTEGKFRKEPGWQTVDFETPLNTRYVAIEIDDTFDGSPAAIAELYLRDSGFNRIPREDWRVLYVTGSELTGNHTPDKLYDQQESTWWQALSSDRPGPQLIVLDLGCPYRVCALDLLPRQTLSSLGHPRRYRVYGRQ